MKKMFYNFVFSANKGLFRCEFFLDITSDMSAHI